MKNTSLERQARRMQDDTEQAVDDLIEEIESLEALICEKDLEIQQLEDKIDGFKEQIIELKALEHE